MPGRGTQRWWWAVTALVGSVPVGCSSHESQYCEFDGECGSGRVCGAPSCTSPKICQPEATACRCFLGDPRTGGQQVLCSGLQPPRCNCDSATCAEPLDSCGEQACPNVCELGDSCDVCLSNGACAVVEPCVGGHCMADGMGGAVCRPYECVSEPLQPPLCGAADAPCGEACVEPACEELECGLHPVLRVSCGTCPTHHYCNTNKCEQNPPYLLCEGDLLATPPEVMVESVVAAMPVPVGGTIADGIYDLVAQREYAAFSKSGKYVRGAMRFTDGASRVEHIYDPRSADARSPHRLLSVVASGTALSFEVTCPDADVVSDPSFTRGFTVTRTMNGPAAVQDDELWLFQEGFIEIYRRRP